MLIAQISDCHIKPAGRLAYRQVDTAACLQRVIADLARRSPAPDAILVTGDIADFGRPEEYALFKELMAPLTQPIHLLPGNHDLRRTMRDAWPDAPWGGEGRLHYAIDLGPLRLICLDSVVEGQSAGRLDGADLIWLDETLAASARPTIVALHHPPFACGIAGMDAIRLEDEAALAAVVARHPQIERIVCGHVHRTIQTMVGGRPAISSPGTAHQVTLDLGPTGPETLIMEPPGYLLHRWSPSQGLVSHSAIVGDFAGPFPFVVDGKLIE